MVIYRNVFPTMNDGYIYLDAHEKLAVANPAVLGLYEGFER
jgi:hypothetical protein